MQPIGNMTFEELKKFVQDTMAETIHDNLPIIFGELDLQDSRPTTHARILTN